VSDDWLNEAARLARPSQVDPNVPNVARVWNFLLGGRDNFEADRRAAKLLVSVAPVVADVVPAARAFMRRAVRYLAAEAGIRQFLDIGTGIPAAGNAHEVAQAVDPSCRVVYVDNDPVVLSHARALLRSADDGLTAYVEADARDPAAILAAAAATLDLSQPVALVMIDVVEFISGPAEVATVLAALLASVVPGSYLALTQPAMEPQFEAVARRWNAMGADPVWLRDRAEVASWFTGLELVDPGIVPVHQWRPSPDDPSCHGGMPLLAGVARRI
jgi:hypothetical protein